MKQVKTLREKIYYFYQSGNVSVPYKGLKIFRRGYLSESFYTSAENHRISDPLFKKIELALAKRDQDDDIEAFNTMLTEILDQHHRSIAAPVAALHLAEFEYLIGNFKPAFNLCLYIINVHYHSSVTLDAMLILAEILYRLENVDACHEVLERYRVHQESVKRTRQKEILDAQKVRPKEDKVISLPTDKLGFEFNEDQLNIEDKNIRNIMERFAEIMENNRSIKLEIRGHTDNVGDHEFNLDLSMRRAKSVKGYLTDLGVGANRILIKGFGETIPITSNRSEEGRASNRRVEFYIIRD